MFLRDCKSCSVTIMPINIERFDFIDLVVGIVVPGLFEELFLGGEGLNNALDFYRAGVWQRRVAGWRCRCTGFGRRSNGRRRGAWCGGRGMPSRVGSRG